MNVAPSANAMAQVRAKPVMREMMVQMLISAAELPTFGGAACLGRLFDMRVRCISSVRSAGRPCAHGILPARTRL